MENSSNEFEVPQTRITSQYGEYAGIVEEDIKEYPYIKIYGVTSFEEISFIKDLTKRTEVEGSTLDFYVTQQKGDKLLEKKICEITMSLDILSQLYFINGDYKITIQSKDKEEIIDFSNPDMVIDFLTL